MGGALSNGSIGSLTAVTLAGATVDNRSGKIVGEAFSATTLDVANDAGLISAQGNLTLNT